MTEEEFRALQRRGEGARAILESEEAQACFAEVEAALMRAWADTRPWRGRKREQFYAEMRGLRALKARLTAVAQDARYERRRHHEKL